ncbi:FecR domain-containing protein [Thermodesulfobacteriota bacterium]
MSVSEERFIKTGKTGLIELTFADKSVIRLSTNTIFKVKSMHFPKKGPKRFSVRLFLGRAWAKLNKVVHKNRDRFDMHIPTAVIGVRGTIYNADTADDKSADIYVFKGTVGVGPPLFVENGSKKEISWSQQVSEKEWEEIILKQLQRLHIGADGKPGKPVLFDPKIEKDEWIIWNLKRDAGSQNSGV